MKKLEVLKIDAYMDGGTYSIKTNKGEFCIDYRLNSKTEGALYKGYPDEGKLVTDNKIKQELINAIEISNEDCFGLKQEILMVLDKQLYLGEKNV